MSEERNQRKVFEGGHNYKRAGGDRRKAARRKSDLAVTILKYLAVALVAALLVKYLG